jgi:hypothetical protein
MREGKMGARERRRREKEREEGGERANGDRAKEREEGVGDRLSPVVLRLGGHRTSSLGHPHPNLRGAGAN